MAGSLDGALASAAEREATTVNPKHAAIVAAAGKLFLTKGFASVSMDEIANLASVSKRTVYSHFENKESLFAGVMISVCEESGPRFSLEESDTVDLKTALRNIGLHTCRIIFSEAGMAIYRTTVTEAPRAPSVGQTFFDTGPKGVFEKLSALLAGEKARGAVDVEDVDAASKAFIALVLEPRKMMVMMGIRELPSEDEFTAHVDWLLPNYLRFIGYRPVEEDGTDLSGT